jgi:uncharacterized protein YciI
MISDEEMQAELARSQTYSFVVLLPGPDIEAATRELIWEHGRRNFQLRNEGVLNVVGPLLDGGEIQGICIFNVSADEAAKIMDGDPAVEAGIFTYEVHPFRGFPGDALS